MRKVVIVVVVLAALGAAGARLFKGGAAHDGVPTHVVTKSKFERRVTAEGNIRAKKATPISAPQSQGDFGPMKIAWLVPDGTTVKTGDVVVKFDPTEPAKQLKEGESDLDAANAKLREEQIKSKAAVDGRDTAAELATQELEQTRQFQSKDEAIFSRHQIVESEIDEHLAGAKRDHAEQTKTIERKLSGSKAAVIGVEQDKAKIAIAHAHSQLDSMEVKAPHDGILVLQRNWRGQMRRVGDQMWPGQSVAELPLLDTMEVEVFVLEVDGSGLKEGQAAELVVESRPDLTYKGKIRLVDKLAKPRQSEVPVQYFAVVIELERTDREVMKPGQRVRAKLILDQEDALVVPRQAIVNNDGGNIVYRRGANGFEPVTVELGAATSGRVVVKKGLAVGDEIALRDPTRTAEQSLGSGSAGAPTKAAP